MDHAFYEIISVNNLFAAWKEFKRGKAKKKDVQIFEFNLEDNLFKLHEELRARTYEPDQYVDFFVRDPKLRHIHKASVRDRVVHQAVFRILESYFEKFFIHDSYSCRINKGTHAGVNRLEEFSRKVSKNYRLPIWVLKCDIRKFFENVDQAKLFELLSRRIRDEDALRLIRKIIKSFETGKGLGLPLGNVTSQLFANIYMNELDQYVKRILKERFYLRYCDDFLILSEDKHRLKNLIQEIAKFLKGQMGLELHPKKIIIRKLSQGIDFLGYIVLSHYRVIRTKTRRRMLRRVSRKSLTSYLGILKHCKGYRISVALRKNNVVR